SRDEAKQSRTHRGSARGDRPRPRAGECARRHSARGKGARRLSDPRHRQAAVRRASGRPRARFQTRDGSSMSGTTTSPAPTKTTFWTMDRVADALTELSDVNLPRGTTTFGRVWTDTRTIESGDLFLALVGERLDAHDFLGEAKAKGAIGVVVSRL